MSVPRSALIADRGTGSLAWCDVVLEDGGGMGLEPNPLIESVSRRATRIGREHHLVGTQLGGLLDESTHHLVGQPLALGLGQGGDVLDEGLAAVGLVHDHHAAHCHDAPLQPNNERLLLWVVEQAKQLQVVVADVRIVLQNLVETVELDNVIRPKLDLGQDFDLSVKLRKWRGRHLVPPLVENEDIISKLE